MLYRMVPLVVVITLVVGCGKSVNTPAAPGTPEASASDPDATYTIKIREDQKGDKTEESNTETGSMEASFKGIPNVPDGKETERQDKKFVFTQEIVEMTAGEKPTKLTRKYTVAQKFDKATNALKATPLEGKTVNIEMKAHAMREKYYDFTADGKPLDVGVINDLRKDFSNANKKEKKGGIEELLPKNAVKVGETWTIDPAALKSFTGDDGFSIDAAKSKLTGKLAKAYSKDGKQWGVIEFDMDIALDPNAKKEKGTTTGNMKLSGTFDTVIDGSSREGTLKMNLKMNITNKDGASEFTISGDMTMEKTAKMLK